MINRNRLQRRRRINGEINRGEDYLCWPRGNKAIIALWGSCKKLHYTAAEAVICYTYCSYTCCSYMCCSSYMFYVLQVYVLQVYLLYVLQVYVLQQLNATCAAAICTAGICAAAPICGCQPWTFGLSGQLKCQLPPPLCVWQQFHKC